MTIDDDLFFIIQICKYYAKYYKKQLNDYYRITITLLCNDLSPDVDDLNIFFIGVS